MADQDILDKSRKFLTEAFASGGGEQERAELLGNNLLQQLLVKHDGDTSAAFRDEVRQFGLGLKKDNPAIRDALLYNEASLKRLVEQGPAGLATDAQKQEKAEMEKENLKDSIGVDEMQPAETDEDAGHGEGEIKGMDQPKIHGLEGIEFDTGNS